jgi:hypothetical protein
LLYILRDEPETRALRVGQLRDSAAVPGKVPGGECTGRHNRERIRDH